MSKKLENVFTKSRIQEITENTTEKLSSSFPKAGKNK